MNTHPIIALLLLSIFHCSESRATDFDSLYHHGVESIYRDTDLAINELTQCLNYFEESGATSNSIKTKLRLIALYSGRGNYQSAYDLAWELMPLIEQNGAAEQQVELYRRLVSLYTIFCQYDKAQFYLKKAFSMTERISSPNQKAKWLINLNNAEAWWYTNSTNDLEQAKLCLFQSLEESKKLTPHYDDFYIRMQLGDLYVESDSLEKAQHILFALKEESSGALHASHSLLYDHLGMMYMKLGQYDKAIESFQTSITALDRHKNHLDNKVAVLDSLAQCYCYMGRNDEAYLYSKQAIEMRDELFGTRSSVNRELYEIKNSYQDHIQEQNLTLLQKEKQLLTFRLILYTSALLLVIVCLIVRATKKSKQQKLIRETQIQEKKRKEEELEIKNKELVSSALQLIERDALLSEIHTTLHSLSFRSNNQKSISSLISSIKANKAKNWDEFDLYFTKVNRGYYQTLKQQYPKLSNTDLKMCALIKIGFSSKEMAEVMGIGADSVKTSRSRIRKKMGLDRDVNLSAHLGAY